MKKLYFTNFTDRPFITREVAEREMAKTEAPQLGTIEEAYAFSKEGLEAYERKVWTAARDNSDLSKMGYRHDDFENWKMQQ